MSRKQQEENLIGRWMARLNPLRWEKEFTEYFDADEEAETIEAVQEQLFGGDDQLFRQLASDCRHYGEYGCGRSTTWMAKATPAEIVSVDTSREWLQRVEAELGEPAGRVQLVHVDLGELADWGNPVSYEQRHRIGDYLAAPWKNRAGQPDLVLIDGRFRVACFLYTLLQAKPGTRVLFDDYRERMKYHVAAEFCPVAQWCGRQALFFVPAEIERERIEEELIRFSYVMD